MRMRKANVFYWMHGKITGMHVKFTRMHGKFTVLDAWLSRVRAHTLHGANSWSVIKKKNPRFLANQIAEILRPII